jgi:hypothetical protein
MHPAIRDSWLRSLPDWCRAGVLGYSEGDCAASLSALSRLWPQHLMAIAQADGRGLAVAAPLIERGLLLHRCEPADGFQPVLRRIVEHGQQHGHSAVERSAYAELVVVASLRHLGYSARHEPALDGRVLDAYCEIEGGPVYFEVVSPEQSDAGQEQEEKVRTFTDGLRRRLAACRVEIELFGPLDPTSEPALVAALESAAAGEWVSVGSIARFRRIAKGCSLPPVFDGNAPQVIVGNATAVQDGSLAIIVRREAPDLRAKRVFRQEYEQLSASVPNVLVVDLCAVSDGWQTWPELIARLLQPMQNRKVGAVFFFEQGCLGPPEAIRRRWRVLVNPNAHLRIPDSLLSGVEGLDESALYGLPRPERVVAK